MSDTGNSCVVEIWVDDYQGNPTQLIGSEEPIELSTNVGEHKWLTPILLTSGFIRVTLDESEWRGIMPTSETSNMVVLKVNNSVAWRGYMVDESLTSTLYGGKQEYEFSVQCPLSVLATMKLPWSQSESQNTFGRLIWRIISLLEEDMKPEYVYVTDNVDLQRIPELAAITDLRQFYDIESRPISTAWSGVEEFYRSPNVTALEMLTEVCKFWGWTLAYEQDTLYFMSGDEKQGYRFVTFAELESLDNTTSCMTIGASTVPYNSQVFASTDHSVMMDTPRREVAVECDMGSDDEVFHLDIEKIGQFESMPSEVENVSGNIHADCIMWRSQINSVFADGILVSWDGSMGHGALQGLRPEDNEYHNAVFRKTDRWTDADDAAKKKYNWKYAIFKTPSFDPHIVNGYKILTMKTDGVFTFDNCAIVIEGKVEAQRNFSADASAKALEVHIRVGNKQWNGSSWINLPDEGHIQWVSVPVGGNTVSEQTKSGQIFCPINYTSPYQGADGYVMPVTTPMSGRLTVILRWTQLPYSSYEPGAEYNWYFITEFKVRAVQAHSTQLHIPELSDKNVYKSTLAGYGEEKIQMKFATYLKNTYTSGLIHNENGGYIQTVQYKSGTERPENHLLGRMERLYGQRTEWRDINVKEAGLPAVAFRSNWSDGSSQWAPMGMTRRWRSGDAIVTLGKLPN